MTLLGFHSLEEGLDLCVIRMIAYNGNANSACRRNGLRYFTDRSGSCPGFEAVVRPSRRRSHPAHQATLQYLPRRLGSLP